MRKEIDGLDLSTTKTKHNWWAVEIRNLVEKRWWEKHGLKIILSTDFSIKENW